MTRTKTILMALLVLAVLMSGCGGKENTADISPDEAAKSILEQVEFANELTRVEGENAFNWYFLDDKVTEHAIYIDGGGGSAEEVAVLKAADAADAEHLKGIMKERLESLEFNFSGYRPNEMAKINNPVIASKGNVVIMVLADDTAAAQKAVDSLLG